MQFLGPSPKGVYLCRRTVLALVRACVRACVRLCVCARARCGVRSVPLLVTEAAGSESLGVEGERVVPQIVRSVKQPRPHLNVGLRKGAWLEGRAPGKVQPRNEMAAYPFGQVVDQAILLERSVLVGDARRLHGHGREESALGPRENEQLKKK